MFFHLTKQNTKVNPKHWVIVLLQVVFFTCFSFIQTIKACDDSSATLISMVNNGNGTYTFVIRVCPEFTGSFDPPNDEHTITVVGATIASFSPASLTHPNGSVYVSNAAGHASTSTVIDYYYPGFSAPGTGAPCYDITVTTNGLPTSFVVATNANGTAWECTTRTIVVGSTVQTTCATTTFQDPGGAANYSNNTAMGTTICPVTPGDHVQVAFNSFAVAANSGVCLDQLQIYQGNAPLNANYIGTYCNATGSPGTILSTTADGCLTFMFLTNDAGTAAGWNATVSCVSPPCASPITATLSKNNDLSCTNTTSTLSATPASGATYVWSAGATAIAGTNQATVASSGTYTVTVTVGACTATASVNVTQNITAPTAAISPTSGTLTCTTTSTALTASGGGTYLWNATGGNATTAGITANAAGTYRVTVTSATNGCTATAQSVITSNTTAPTATVSPTNGTLTCSTTSIALTASGGGTYAWNPTGGNATTAGISATAAGTYVVTVTSATNGCTATAQSVISSNTTAPTANISPANGTLTCTTTSIALTASGGGTYLWNATGGNATTAGISATAAGTYVVTVTSPANGCTASAQSVISSNTTAPTASVSPNSGTRTCTVTSIPLTASGGGTYLWNATGGNSTNANITASAAGTYVVTVTNPANGCTASAQSVITNNTTPPTATVSPTSGTLTCSTTSIALTASGGGTYLWNATGGNSTNANITASAAGTYVVTVTSATNGCTATAQSVISSNTTAPVASISPNSGTLTCTTTSIALTASGGGTYAWNPTGGNATTAGISATAAGTYVVTVTSATNGCTATAQSVINSNTTAPTANISPANSTLTCTTTSIALTASGGGTYLWNATGGNATTAGISATAAGTYVVTVTNPANGCTASAQSVISSNTTAPTASISPASGTLTCATTSIALTASGGGTYLWNATGGNSNSANITASAAGTYAVTVTNTANGCTASASVVITSNTTAPTASVSPTNGTLTCATTSIALTASGGGTYLWNATGGNATTAGISATAAGTYVVTVTSATNGCTATAQSVITSNTTAPIASVSPTSATLTCASPSTTLTASGGGTYLWNSTGGNATTAGITANAAGTYVVTVTSATNGCTATAQSIISSSAGLPTASISPASGTLTCSTTTIALTASGGGTYLWNATGGNSTNANITASAAGTYVVTVTNTANGCTASASVIITSNTTAPTASVSPTNGTLTCTTTTIALTASGGGTYLWNATGGNSTNSNITASAAGTYVVTVTNPANGCTATAQSVITSNTTAPVANISPNSGTLTCTTTSITLTASGGGSYAWNLTGGNATTASISATAAGTYVVTVTNPANGCTATAQSVISSNTTAPTASISPASGTLTCTTTSIALTAAGGGTYLWNATGGNATTAGISATAAGTYVVTVTNPANGCTASAQSVITSNTTAPTASVSPTNGTITCTTTSIPLTASGGGTYLWNATGGNSTNANITASAAGTYVVTVTNPVNGCTATAQSVISSNTTAPTANVSPINGTITCTTTSIALTASGGGTYLWNATGSNATTAGISATAAGTYIVTVTNNANGCTATAQSVISSNTTAPTASINPISGTRTCLSPTLALTASGGGTYLWNNLGGNATTANITASVDGTYVVTVTNPANGCTATAQSIISSSAGLPTASISPSSGIRTCTTPNITLMALGGGTYLWNATGSNSTNANIVASVDGTYVVTVTNPANGCTASASVVITSNTTAPTASINPTSGTLTCTTTTIPLTASGGDTYAWNITGGNATTAGITASTAGTYVVTVTSTINGCTATASSSITQDITIPTVSISPANTILCAGGSVLLSASGGGNYLWNAAASNATSSSITANATGTYNVTVTTPSNGCTASATASVLVNPNPVIALTGGGSYCEGDAILLSATGGSGYDWSGPNGFTSNSANPSIPICGLGNTGQYNVTATTAAGCTGTASLNITVNALPNPTVSSNSPICAGTTLTLNATGGTSYAWSGPNGFTATTTNPSINNTTTSNSGIYTLTATNAAGCSATATTLVTVNALPTASANNNSPLCAGNTITLNANGGLTYNWTGVNSFTANTANPSINNATIAATGTYNVTVTDGNGCTASASTNATINATPTISASNTSPVCSGTNIQLTATGGTSYVWSGPSGFSETIANPSILSAQVTNNGTYSVTVTDANTCSAVTTTTLLVNPNPTLALNSVTNPTCFGASNGSINIDEALGNAPFTYTWSNTALGNTEDPSNTVGAGTYSVTVSTVDACTATLGNITLTAPSALALTLTGTTNVSCQGVCDASITVNATGGTAGYNYTWSDVNLPNSPNPTTVCAGTYALTISDQQGCTATLSNIIITEPTVLSATETHTDASCFNACNGTISITATGGTAPYTYNWSSPLGNINNPTGLCAGAYSVTITDANACSIVLTGINIQEPLSLGASVQSITDATCFNTCNGTIILDVVGGNAPYTFQWSAPALGNTATPTGIVCAGTYSVTVTDASTCTATLSNIIVNEPTVLTTLLVNTNNLTCNPSNAAGATDGTIDIDVQGGTAPYNYTWSNASFGNVQDPTGTPAGIFSVTVTDLQGCTSVLGNIAIAQPSALSATFIVGNTLCNAANSSTGTGTIDMSVTNGLAPYSYVWSNAELTEDLQNLNSGPYTVTITDLNGCTGTASAFVSSPSPVVITSTFTNPSCAGSTNAHIDISVVGGTQGATGYTYTWSNGTTSQDIANVPAGNYCLTVTDANGCTATSCQLVNDPPVLQVTIGSVLQATCHGTCNGRATAQATGGTTAINIYTYEWNDGQSTPTATGLCAGSHTVTITDDNGCTATASVTITEPSALDLTINANNITCFSGSDGTANATATGGTAPYSFEWSNNLVGQSITGLATGNYSLTVTDANTCTYSEPFFIASPNPFAIVTSTTDATCFGLSDGTISANPFGGTAPYTYQWSDAQTTAMAVNVPANITYSVTVSDAQGCTTSAINLSVNQPTVLSALTTVLTTVSCNGEIDGTATVATAGGTPAYTYLWDNLETSNLATGLDAGTHRVTVTDNNGCTAIATLSMSEPAPLVAVISHTNALCYNEANGTIVVDTIFGGTAPYEMSLDSLTWAPNISTGYTFEGLSAGTYDVWIRDANGCSLYFTQSISQPVEIGLNVEGISLQLGESGTLNPSVINLPAGSIYTWSPADTTISCENCEIPTVNPTETTIYTLTVVGANGCGESDTALVMVGKQRRVYIPTAFTPNSDDNNDVFTIYGGTGVLRVKKMLIFDRWGELVFEQSNFPPADPAYGWDGTFKGRLVNATAFVYYIEVEFMDGQVIPYKGDVSLIR